MWHLTPLIAFAALLSERAVGYPHFLQARIGYPVEWMGAGIDLLDRALNSPDRPERARFLGVLALVAILAACLAIAVPIAVALRTLPFGWVLEGLLATSFLAQKQLESSVAAVADGLDQGLDRGREAVAHVVGRDPHALDGSGVARAAIESLAENASDGVIAPAFWLTLFGLPGIVLYKAINTADSMIGHRSERYLRFGWASARLDDLVNLIPARLTGLLFAAAAALERRSSGIATLRAMRRDAGKHVSPNAGWPESAVAGALGIRLGGPRSYHGRTVALPWLGDGREALSAEDIRRALGLYRRMLSLATLLAGGLAFVCLLSGL